jgi:polysaccharide pyruvyl transferase WcaK-like protein
VWGGWYGSRNIGDTAILLGIRELYKKINAGKHYYIGFLSTDVDYTSTNGVSGKQALVKSDLLKPWKYGRLIQVFNEADRVIISGGTPIFDFSHKIRTFYFLLPVMLKKPFILFGAGVKPIKSWYGRKYIPFTLKRAEYVSTRDDGSTEILKDMGVDTAKTADSAFFAPAASRETLDPVLEKYGIKWGEKILVVAPRLMSPDKKRLYLDEDMGKDVITETPKKIAKAIDNVAGKFDKVVFMAMHYYGPDSDYELIKETMALTKTKKKVFIEEELRAEIAIALFKHARIVLAMRLHALLLSASMCTPMVGVAYEQKVQDLFKRLEMEPYVTDMFTFSAKDLTTILEDADKNHAKLSKHLEKRVTQLRELILKDARKVLRIGDEYSDKQKS